MSATTTPGDDGRVEAVLRAPRRRRWRAPSRAGARRCRRRRRRGRPGGTGRASSPGRSSCGGRRRRGTGAGGCGRARRGTTSDVARRRGMVAGRAGATLRSSGRAVTREHLGFGGSSHCSQRISVATSVHEAMRRGPASLSGTARADSAVAMAARRPLCSPSLRNCSPAFLTSSSRSVPATLTRIVRIPRESTSAASPAPPPGLPPAGAGGR